MDNPVVPMAKPGCTLERFRDNGKCGDGRKDAGLFTPSGRPFAGCASAIPRHDIARVLQEAARP